MRLYALENLRMFFLFTSYYTVNLYGYFTGRGRVIGYARRNIRPFDDLSLRTASRREGRYLQALIKCFIMLRVVKKGSCYARVAYLATALLLPRLLLLSRNRVRCSATARGVCTLYVGRYILP